MSPSGGIALLCDREGIILQVYRDDLAITSAPSAGAPFTTLTGPDGSAKARAFLDAVLAERAAFDWELTMPVGGEPRALHFNGGLTDDGSLLIVGSYTRAGIDRVYSDMLSIGNEQAGLVRALMTEHAGQSRDRAERDSSQYDDLTRLNNDLATAHRELAKTSAEMARLNEQKNLFLGIAAHDLRNPLGAIAAFSDLLLEEAADVLSPEHLDFVEQIKSQSEFMLHLVNDLLDVAKIEAGKLELDRTPVDLVAMVKRALTLTNSQANKKRIALQFTSGDAPLVVSLDPGKIQQVLTNLITNSIKFSAAGTTVEVRVICHAGEAVLSVRDQGPGIPAAELATLFRPFQRTSVKSTAGESSTGLGLVIVRKVVEGHGGRIWVESTLGAGSTFFVALPSATRER
ncbi:MAG: HAMP domain-containing sensor histidine kinase [bacterium]